MKSTLHRANTRGYTNHGWLKSYHSFSFSSYYNQERMGFGLLRVLNDDYVEASGGFSAHPHQDMEIVSIPLSGALRHKDSKGNDTIIRYGEVQLMSAGTGVYHSEYNASQDCEVNFLQIWVMPEKRGIQPRYDQRKFEPVGRKNKFQNIVAPLDSDIEGLKINQQAYFSLLDLEASKIDEYKIHRPDHGVYLFVLEGEVEIEDQVLNTRDALGIEKTKKIPISARNDSQLLLIEVPMI